MEHRGVLDIEESGAGEVRRRRKVVGAAALEPEEELSVHRLSVSQFAAVCVGLCYLSLAGGIANGSALGGVFGTTLSHLTGTSTRVGVSLAIPPGKGQYGVHFYVAQIFAFFLGAMLAAILLGRERTKWRGRQTVLLFVETALLFAAPLVLPHSTDTAAHLISCACGLQNSITTNVTILTLRSTHVTGTVVDIASALGLSLREGWDKHGWRLVLLLPAYLCFILGAYIGATAYATTASPSSSLFIAPSLLLLAAALSTAFTATKGGCKKPEECWGQGRSEEARGGSQRGEVVVENWTGTKERDADEQETG